MNIFMILFIIYIRNIFTAYNLEQIDDYDVPLIHKYEKYDANGEYQATVGFTYLLDEVENYNPITLKHRQDVQIQSENTESSFPISRIVNKTDFESLNDDSLMHLISQIAENYNKHYNAYNSFNYAQYSVFFEDSSKEREILAKLEQLKNIIFQNLNLHLLTKDDDFFIGLDKIIEGFMKIEVRMFLEEQIQDEFLLKLCVKEYILEKLKNMSYNILEVLPEITSFLVRIRTNPDCIKNFYCLKLMVLFDIFSYTEILQLTKNDLRNIFIKFFDCVSFNNEYSYLYKTLILLENKLQQRIDNKEASSNTLIVLNSLFNIFFILNGEDIGKIFSPSGLDALIGAVFNSTDITIGMISNEYYFFCQLNTARLVHNFLFCFSSFTNLLTEIEKNSKNMDNIRMLINVFVSKYLKTTSLLEFQMQDENVCDFLTLNLIFRLL